MLVTRNNRNTTAHKRILQILDEGSFMEMGEHISARLTSFYKPEQVVESDGVITGYGTVEGNLVYIFSQDNEVMGGSFGEMHGQKIINLYQHAMKAKAPIIGLLDCDGFRIEEGLDGLNKFANLYEIQAKASKIIPQIMAVVGQCGGGMSFVANMADIVLIEKEKGELFVNPQSIVENCIGDNTIEKDFSDGKLSCQELINSIKTLINIMPASSYHGVTPVETQDNLNRLSKTLKQIKNDGRGILEEISDNNFFFETKSHLGKDMVTGFIRINGYPIGAVANTISKGQKRITAEGCDKAAAMVDLCDKFHIPILTITNTEGFRTAKEEEKYLPRAAGRMIKSLAFAKVPKVNLITDTIYGSAYSMMNSKGLGADYVFMWEDANVNIVNPRQAVEMLYGNFDVDKAKEYRETQSSAVALARHGYVDKVIRPEETRKYLAGAFETFANIN